MATLTAAKHNIIVKKQALPTVMSPAEVLFSPFGKNKSLEKTGKKIWSMMENMGAGGIIEKGTHVAVKQHFGEEGNEGYIKPEITKEIVSGIAKYEGKPTLIETNTLYAKARHNSHDHIKTAASHGFTLENVGAPIVIIDGMQGSNYKLVEIDGKHYDKVALGGDIVSFKSFVGVSHVKGHALGGMGGTIKNLSMGIASRIGKLEMHADFTPDLHPENCVLCGACVHHCPVGALSIKNGKIVLDKIKCIGCGECVTACAFDAIRADMDQIIGVDGDHAQMKRFQERMAEYALGVISLFPERQIYVNIINNLTKYCDCWGEANPIMGPDIGVLVSRDPVALDVATFRLIEERVGKDIFKQAFPDTLFMHGIKHLAGLNGGSTEYKVKEV